MKDLLGFCVAQCCGCSEQTADLLWTGIEQRTHGSSIGE
jgi:hypothetical protein